MLIRNNKRALIIQTWYLVRTNVLLKRRGKVFDVTLASVRAPLLGQVEKMWYFGGVGVLLQSRSLPSHRGCVSIAKFVCLSERWTIIVNQNHIEMIYDMISAFITPYYVKQKKIKMLNPRSYR